MLTAEQRAIRRTGAAQWLEMTPAQYHAPVEPGAVPPLSHSLAKEMLSRSPAHARRKWLSRGILDPKSEEQVEARRRLEFGTLVHAALLGERDDRIVECDFENWLTKLAKEKKAAARAAGRIPVLPKDIERARDFADRVRPKLLAEGIDLSEDDSGRRFNEQPIEWTEEGVICRAMFDHVDLANGVIVDLKTTGIAHPDQLRRYAVDRGYDLQHAAYTSALEHLHQRYEGRVRFVFAFCEVGSADVILVELGGDFAQLGRQRWARALRTWRRCIEANEWPGYPRRVTLECPEWALAAEARAQYETNELAAMVAPRPAESPSEPPEENDDGNDDEDNPF